MKIIRNIIVAFALYSRIPMPIFTWKKEDMEYSIAFLPFIGLVIGAIEYLCFNVSLILNIPIFVKTMIFTLIPLIITGGFHVDGFMDVNDAFNSYKSKEEKLEILKDPHIGAFSVISLVIFGGIYVTSAYLLFYGIDANKEITHIWQSNLIVVACLSFYVSRIAGGLCSLLLKHGKKEGMLHSETKDANKKSVIILIIQLIIAGIAIFAVNHFAFVCATICILLFTLYFRNRCYKEFGGITGDTAGYYITVSEGILLMCLAILMLV